MLHELAGVCLLLIITAVALPARAGAARIALVHDESRREKWVEEQFLGMETVLRGAEVRFTSVTGGEIERGRLSRERYDIAVLPYCPGLSAEVRGWLNLFCADGGKAAVFYDPLGLEAHLGLSGTGYVAQEFDGQFAEVRFTESAPPGAPRSFRQSSWNIRTPSPGPGTKVIAHWHDATGKRTPYAAASISDGGMFFSHILLAEDTPAAAAFMKAAISYLAAAPARRAAPVAIVRGTLTEKADPGGDGKAVADFCKAWRLAFAAGGAETIPVTDEMVAKGVLEGRALAVMPLNHHVTDEELRALAEYVAGGGKLVVCFNGNKALGSLVGADVGGFTPGEGKRFARMGRKGDAGALSEVLPREVFQNAWNAFACAPAPGASVLYEWLNASGAVDPVPAVVVSSKGAYFSAPLLGKDASANGALALGLYLKLCGTKQMRGVVEKLLGRLWYFRRYETAEEFLGGLLRKGMSDLATRLRRMEGQDAYVRSVLRRHEPSDEALLDCYRRLRRGRSELEEVFVRHASSPRTELRAVWCHAPSMADWDATFSALSDAGFNAFIPNMCHGRDAFYPSDFLKPSKKLPGDRMTPMLEAAARHGIEVHVWKVNWNIWWHDREDYEELVRAGRIAVDRDGKVASFSDAFLCPSHPENCKLEIDSMLEIVDKFPGITGIHFDYIRYRNARYCYCEGCHRRFERVVGKRVANWPRDALDDGRYLDFRRDSITRVVREVSEGARKRRRDVKVSAAVFSHWAQDRDRIGQDTVRWIEKGYLDFVCPMNYTADAKSFLGRVSRQTERLKGASRAETGRVRYTPGIGAFIIGSVWEIADQIMIAREHGSDGFVLFDYHEGGAPLPYLEGLKLGPLRRRARTPWGR